MRSEVQSKRWIIGPVGLSWCLGVLESWKVRQYSKNHEAESERSDLELQDLLLCFLFSRCRGVVLAGIEYISCAFCLSSTCKGGAENNDTAPRSRIHQYGLLNWGVRLQ